MYGVTAFSARWRTKVRPARRAAHSHKNTSPRAPALPRRRCAPADRRGPRASPRGCNRDRCTRCQPGPKLGSVVALEVHGVAERHIEPRRRADAARQRLTRRSVLFNDALHDGDYTDHQPAAPARAGLAGAAGWLLIHWKVDSRNM